MKNLETHLVLDSADLNKKGSLLPDIQIVRSIDTAPESVSSLYLHFTQLFSYPTPEIIKFFSLFPNLESLKIDAEKLWNKSPAELKQIFSAFPRTLKKIRYRSNDSDHLDGDKLMATVTALPTDLESLDISYNYIGDIAGGIPTNIQREIDLIAIFKKFPPRLTKLKLSNNGLWYFDADVLVQCMQVLPSTMIELSLADNFLGHFEPQEFVQILLAIAPNIKILNLDENSFGTARQTVYEQEDYSALCNALPESLTELSVKCLNVGYEKLLGFFMNSPNVKKLGIDNLAPGHSCEGYGITDNEIQHLLSLIPTSVVILNLGRFDFFRKDDRNTLANLAAIPTTVQTVLIWTNHIMNRTQLLKGIFFKDLDLYISTKDTIKRGILHHPNAKKALSNFLKHTELGNINLFQDAMFQETWFAKLGITYRDLAMANYAASMKEPVLKKYNLRSRKRRRLTK